MSKEFFYSNNNNPEHEAELMEEIKPFLAEQHEQVEKNVRRQIEELQIKIGRLEQQMIEKTSEGLGEEVALFSKQADYLRLEISKLEFGLKHNLEGIDESYYPLSKN